MIMKKLLTTLLLVAPVLLHAQTAHLEATTSNTKNIKLDVLFEENESGQIVYTDVVHLDGKDTDLKQLVKDYIDEEKGRRECEINYIVDTSRKIVAEITMPIGKQYFALEFWGSPIAAWNRDASRIKFTCTVDFLNNKYRYKLDNFWTENRRVRGEAKDNGETNVIYKQRVSCMQREYDEYAMTHYVTQRTVKEKLYDLQAAINNEKILYQASYKAVMDFIDGMRNLKKVDADGDFDTETPTEAKKVETAVPSEIQNYHGNLLAKGNKVYVLDTGLEPYEQSGAMEIVKQITIDEAWEVVSNPAMAHFIIEYHVSTEGRDHAWVEIWSNDRQTVYKDFYGSRKGSSESISENREVARSIYLSGIQSILKKVEAGTLSEDAKLRSFDR